MGSYVVQLLFPFQNGLLALVCSSKELSSREIGEDDGQLKLINNAGELRMQILELAVAVLDSLETAVVGVSDGDCVDDFVILYLMADNLELIGHNIIEIQTKHSHLHILDTTIKHTYNRPICC